MEKEIDFEQINLEGDAPLEEPARQYYFIAKCREWVKAFEQEQGRLPRSCVVNYGCPFVNV